MSNAESGIEMIDVKSEEILEYLNGLLDKAVLIPIPFGQKGPKFKGWQRTTYETIPWDEIKRVIAKGGNLGVILGPPSGNLVTMDLDSDEEMIRFFKFAPWALNTLITRGAKGCQVWFYIEGQYPNKRMVWKNSVDKRPTIEFRGGEIQSVIWGKHPDIDGRYTNNGKKPAHIPYYDLEEYRILLRKQGEDADEEVYRQGQKEDFTWTKRYKGCDLKELDMAGLLKEAGIKYKIKNEEGGIDKYAIQCPWIQAHSSPNGEWDATVHMFEPRGRYWPAFKCLHSHCNGRHLKDLLEWLEQAHGLGPGTVRKYCGSKRTRLVIVDRTELMEAPSLPDPIIDGLVYPELKMLIASAAKIGKTWMGIDLGLTLAHGQYPWMDFDTCQTNVLYLNLEMPVPWFDQRVCMIRKAKRIDKLSKGSFMVANLRGSDALEGRLDALYEVSEEYGPFGVIIYDPIYKLLGDLDENKATDVAKLLRMIDAVGKVTGAANILIHHYAKGDAWMKKAGDRASGSGVFLRDPDTYMAITEMGEEDSGVARVDCRLRCSKPVGAFGIKWDNYQWKRDSTIDIAKKKAKDKDEEAKARGPTLADKMLQILMDNPQGMTYTAWKVETVTTRGLTTEGGFENKIADLKRSGKILQKDKLYFVPKIA